jgi:hypothetical protein
MLVAKRLSISSAGTSYDRVVLILAYSVSIKPAFVSVVMDSVAIFTHNCVGDEQDSENSQVVNIS